jgi:NADH-quinone oxidoreductase subunit L
LTILPWLIWTLPIAGAILTPLFAKVHGLVRDYAAVAFSLGAAVAATITAFTVASSDYQIPWVPQLNLNAGVLVDPLSMFLVNIVAWISFLIMVYSLQYMRKEFGLTRYWFFMNLFIGNMLLLVLADNLLMMFFGWEGVGLCSYALIGHFYHDEPEHWVGTPGDTALGVPQAYPPSHAGMKAFIMTRIGDIALLIAIFLIFATSAPRTFNYVELASQLGKTGSWASTLVGFGLLVPTALLFFGGPVGKSAQFPLQEWLPDAMAGPTSVSALIHAATMVKAGVFLVGRMGPIFFIALLQFNEVTPFFGTVAWVGAFTAFLAATQASVAREIKKVLAYSTVSQIGYMMMALGVAGLSANFLVGYSAGLLQLMSHAIFKASLFLAAGWVIHATESRFMDQMGGLAKAMRLTSVSMLLAGLSLMGIPPFSGFWTKDAVLSAAFQGSQYLLYAIGLVTVLLTAFYTTRMLGITFAGKPSANVEDLEKQGKHAHEAGLIMLVPYLALAIISLGLGLLYPLYSGSLTNYLMGTFHYLTPTLSLGTIPGFSTTDAILFAASTVLAAIGFALGYLRYFRRPYQAPAQMKGLLGFLWHRWYIDAIYYRIFVGGLTKLSRGLYRYVEQGIWDKLSPTVARDVIDYTSASGSLDSSVVDRGVNDVARAGSRLSNLLRRFQSGVTEQYVITFAIGIILLLVYMIFVIGAR